MIAQPGMIERGMVADEIEKQSHFAFAQLSSHQIDIVPRANPRIRLVLSDRVGRTDDVVRRPSGKGLTITGIVRLGCLAKFLGYADRKSTRLNSSHMSISYA